MPFHFHATAIGLGNHKVFSKSVQGLTNGRRWFSENAFTGVGERERELATEIIQCANRTGLIS